MDEILSTIDLSSPDNQVQYSKLRQPHWTLEWISSRFRFVHVEHIAKSSIGEVGRPYLRVTGMGYNMYSSG